MENILKMKITVAILIQKMAITKISLSMRLKMMMEY